KFDVQFDPKPPSARLKLSKGTCGDIPKFASGVLSCVWKVESNTKVPVASGSVCVRLAVSVVGWMVAVLLLDSRSAFAAMPETVTLDGPPPSLSFGCPVQPPPKPFVQLYVVVVPGVTRALLQIMPLPLGPEYKSWPTAPATAVQVI